jgi:hypothetical protein
MHPRKQKLAVLLMLCTAPPLRTQVEKAARLRVLNFKPVSQQRAK